MQEELGLSGAKGSLKGLEAATFWNRRAGEKSTDGKEETDGGENDQRGQAAPARLKLCLPSVWK